MSTRLKKVAAVPIKDLDEVKRLLVAMHNITTLRDGRLLVMEKQIAAVRERHQESLDNAQSVLKFNLDRLELWADLNKKEFGELKSMQLPCARLGWRTGNRALKLLSRKWNWEKVLAAIKEVPKYAKAYVRTEESENRQALIDDRELLGKEALASIGVEVVQEETFFVELERQARTAARLTSEQRGEA